MSKRDWIVALTLAGCAIGLLACGGSSSGSGGGGGESAEASREEARLRFAECMREHGVEMPDPQPGQPGIVIGGPDSDFKPGDPATQEALAACEEEMPDIGAQISEEDREEFQEGVLAFAECMREHGVEMPDPQFDGAGKVRMMLGKGSGVDPDSPAFQAAQEACQDEMPAPPTAP